MKLISSSYCINIGCLNKEDVIVTTFVTFSQQCFMFFRFSLTMPLHPDLASMLEKLDLVAVDVNEGWTVIRRRMFIDLFIGEKPYSSLEVFHHHSSGVSRYFADKEEP